MTKRLRTGAILGAALMAAQLGLADNHQTNAGMSRVEREVRREIVTLPFYSLFDHFAFRVDGETVTLMGKVSRPTLKSDAENVVKRIEGVEKVNNEIEVLPLSPNDDRLRLALYHAIYGHSALQTLAIRAVPPIHIIVENGNVTLEGVVANEMQKNIANAQANGVSGVFSVTNNLRAESQS
jgi:hyperosmotically inducible periplasmic protein